MSFRCNHCGMCCEETATQINVTLGDIKRLADFLRVRVSDLFPSTISINPFKADKEGEYDLELGLNIPCDFRKDKQCKHYIARPLNCRIFPYWILGNAPREKLAELIHEDNKCTLDFTDEEKERYKKYGEKIGWLIMKESEMTDKFMHRFKKSVSATHKGDSKEDERARVAEAKSKVVLDDYKELPKLIEEEIVKHDFISIAELKNIEP